MSLAWIRMRGNFSSEYPHRSCFASVVHHDLNAKHAFAFGIDLQSQFAAVQLKDRQIIRRFLDRYLPLGWVLFAPVKFRALLVAKDGFNSLEVQQHATAVNQGLKNLIHLPTGGENKVAAVFDLIVGILIMEPAAFLLFQIKGETQATAINPTLANLTQSPYSLLSREGICDLG